MSYTITFSGAHAAADFIRQSITPDVLRKGFGEEVFFGLKDGTHIESVKAALNKLYIEDQNITVLPDDSGRTNCGGFKVSGRESLRLLAVNDFVFAGSDKYKSGRTP